jgi:hypothetical protein
MSGGAERVCVREGCLDTTLAAWPTDQGSIPPITASFWSTFSPFFSIFILSGSDRVNNRHIFILLRIFIFFSYFFLSTP